MSRALTPDLALAYLRELQPGVRDAELGPPGAPLGARAGTLRARSGNLEIAVTSDPIALPGLLAHDLERVLEVANG